MPVDADEWRVAVDRNRAVMVLARAREDEQEEPKRGSAAREMEGVLLVQLMIVQDFSVVVQPSLAAFRGEKRFETNDKESKKLLSLLHLTLSSSSRLLSSSSALIDGFDLLEPHHNESPPLPQHLSLVSLSSCRRLAAQAQDGQHNDSGIGAVGAGFGLYGRGMLAGTSRSP